MLVDPISRSALHLTFSPQPPHTLPSISDEFSNHPNGRFEARKAQHPPGTKATCHALTQGTHRGGGGWCSSSDVSSPRAPEDTDNALSDESDA